MPNKLISPVSHVPLRSSASTPHSPRPLHPQRPYLRPHLRSSGGGYDANAPDTMVGNRIATMMITKHHARLHDRTQSKKFAMPWLGNAHDSPDLTALRPHVVDSPAHPLPLFSAVHRCFLQFMRPLLHMLHPAPRQCTHLVTPLIVFAARPLSQPLSMFVTVFVQ